MKTLQKIWAAIRPPRGRYPNPTQTFHYKVELANGLSVTFTRTYTLRNLNFDDFETPAKQALEHLYGISKSGFISDGTFYPPHQIRNIRMDPSA
ncbi:MAG: hypothetical protein ACK4S4_15965 [Pyrinomonadaceae bacterium]